MKFITIALVCLVVGASAVEQAGFFDKVKSTFNKVKDVVKPIVNHPIVKDQLLPVAQQAATNLANQQLAKKNIPIQFAEEAGFFDKVKNTFNKVKDVVKPIVNHPIVKDQLLPVAQQAATNLANQQLAKKNIPIQFSEESGLFDKIKDIGKKVINHPIVKDQLIPLAKDQANQQLAKKNIPIQFSEESGLFDKIKDIGKKVINHPIVKDQLIPLAKDQANQQLAKKNIPIQFSEESGLFDKIKDIGKKVINHPIVKDQLIPLAKDQANQQLAKKNIPIQFAEESGLFDKIKDLGKKVINHPVVKEQVLPFVQQQGTKIVNDQLAKKNIPLSF